MCEMVLVPVVCGGLKGEFDTETKTVSYENSQGRQTCSANRFQVLAGKGNYNWKKSIRLDLDSEELKKSSDYESFRVIPSKHANKGASPGISIGTWAEMKGIKVDKKPRGLQDAVGTLLGEPGVQALTLDEMVDLTAERAMWNWKDVKKPKQSVYIACNNHLDIVWVAPNTYALKPPNDRVKRDKPVTLTEAVFTLLQEAGEEGLTCEQMVAMIKEREMYDWKGVKKPKGSISSLCCNHPSIVRVAPNTFALRALREKSEGSSENVQKTTGHQSTRESSEPHANSEQDSEEQTDAEATRLTASGRASKAPSRLGSLEEWERVTVWFMVFFILLLFFINSNTTYSFAMSTHNRNVHSGQVQSESPAVPLAPRGQEKTKTDR